MLCLDNTLLSDYLNERGAAEQFLQQHRTEPWAVSSLALYEALMGSVYGHIGTDPETIRLGVNASMEVLPVTERTAAEAAALQEELLDRGEPAGPVDALLAATAREHGATFATADRHFWRDDGQDVLDVAEYDPSQ